MFCFNKRPSWVTERGKAGRSKGQLQRTFANKLGDRYLERSWVYENKEGGVPKRGVTSWPKKEGIERRSPTFAYEPVELATY